MAISGRRPDGPIGVIPTSLVNISRPGRLNLVFTWVGLLNEAVFSPLASVTISMPGGILCSGRRHRSRPVGQWTKDCVRSDKAGDVNNNGSRVVLRHHLLV